ncbi:hypothetical protein K474DRAFT_1703299 [Panus rudis PR-1116 ss-1]|nr:hypothetical protein K474DRAFT_1703299 [Panus rudis PR-1116 ss-1]
MSTADPWSDFATVRHNVKQNTVERLKRILDSWNSHCGTNLTKTGKKQEIIQRIVTQLDYWRNTNNVDVWLRAKAALDQARSANGYTAPRRSTEVYAQPSTSTGYYAPAPSTYPSLPTTSANPRRFDTFVSRPAYPPPPAATSTASTPSIRFRHSPFFRIEKLVSSIVECPESTSSMDRRQQSLNFQITPDVLQKLNSQSPQYQLRLYCTSSTYYSSIPAFRTNTEPCPIEFPPTCEVRVNNVQLNANLKGLKKKPGTAPPPALGKALRLTPGASNRIEMVYVNSQQPIQAKKYYMAVMLVEVTTVEQLIDRLRKGKYKSNTEILAKMKQNVEEEDDIVAGHQKMSLKCPLSYMRITTPCRSWHCVHPQCFDAFSFFSVMEQTTTWMCPVCERVLNVDDLIIDGYFDTILKFTPEDVEDVIVEPDGEWHTVDNKYGTSAWKAKHPMAAPQPPNPAKRRTPSPKPDVSRDKGKASAGPSNAEIVILDSDDEDEGRVKRELSPSFNASTSAPPRSQTIESDVIDLTLDSDDEGPPPTTPSTQSHGTKRRSDERDPSPSERIWKKSRVDKETPPAQLSAPPQPQNGYSPTQSVDSLPPSSPTSSNRFHPVYQARSPPFGGGYPAGLGLSSLPPRPPPPISPTNVRYPEGGPYYPNGSGRPAGSAGSSYNSWRSHPSG